MSLPFAGDAVWIERASARVPVRTRDRQPAVRHRLTALDLAPASLPPASILIVRRLAGTVGRSRNGTRDDGTALRETIASLAASAAQPARGRTGDGSAVYFRDELELLACLLDDSVRGIREHRWYWRGIAGRFGRPFSMAAVLESRPASLPGLIAALDTLKITEAVLNQLPGHSCLRLVEAVLSAHDLPKLEVLISKSAGGTTARALRAPSNNSSTSKQPPLKDHATTEAPGVVHAPHQLLANVARVLVGVERQPRRLILERIAHQIEVSCGASSDSARPSLEDRNTPPAPFGAGVNSQTDSGASSTASTRSEPNVIAVSPDRSAAATVIRSESDAVDAAVASAARPQTPADVAVRPGMGTAAERPPSWKTGYAGVFNLIRALDELAPNDWFESCWVRARRTGFTRWALLELVAMELLRRQGRIDRRDELWQALAELDGRHVGTRVPRSLQRRLRSRIRTLAGRIPGWLQRHLGREFEVAQLVVRSKARLFVTPMHLDVVWPIDEIQIAIRRAALDADPGWLPAWGRIVRFHFSDDPGAHP